ncbi:MAG: electron transfer flavoprotein subunit alpha [Thermodesulfobacteriota bacterium]
MLLVNAERCNACGLCEKTCPFGAIAVKDKIAEVGEACTLCGACLNACPQDALSLERKQVRLEDLARYRNVFVWAECESRQGRLRPKRVVYELLSQGRRLADRLGQDLAAIVLGDDSLTDMETLGHQGADRVLVCRHELLGRYTTDGFTHVLAAVIAKEKPAVVLYGATPNGRDLAPRVAARLRLGLTADCTGLDIDEQDQLVQTRPAFGGNIMASIVSPFTRPQTATVRPNVFAAAAADPSRSPAIQEIQVSLPRTVIRTKVVEEIRLEGDAGAGIDEARVIVSGGRGCHEAANLKPLKDLAAELGGVLAGSRAIVELGWIPHTLQVGQSGITVGPDLYIAVGISGAIQHLVGMNSSKTIIAVNKDPDAPVFKVADLAVVGDAQEIIPRLLEEVRRLKKGET